MTIEAPQKPEAEESHILRVPKNMSPELRLKLETKRDEYLERNKQLSNDMAYLAPEQLHNHKYVSAFYKLKIADALVNVGSIDLDDLKLWLIENTGYIDDKALSNAAEVVYRYLYEGGEGVSGGTGF